MAPEDLPGDYMPEDPFVLDLPGFETLTGSHADEIRRFITEFASGRFDYSALLHQQSFLKLRTAIWALDDERARAVLLRAIATSVALHMNDPKRFAQWIAPQ
jgi:hypothetical protein